MDSNPKHGENLKVYHILTVKNLSNLIIAKHKTFVVKHVSSLFPFNVYQMNVSQCFNLEIPEFTS